MEAVFPYDEDRQSDCHQTRLGKLYPDGGRKVIELDPGMAFGTGTHATTRMCIERLEELVTPNIDVYDVGTGSGILAMTAALMGARSIHAIDIDGKAVEVAKENIAKITFPTGLRSKGQSPR